MTSTLSLPAERLGDRGTGARSPTGIRLLVLVLTVVGATALNGCESAEERTAPTATTNGPLEVSTGFKSYSSPTAESLFTTFTGCVHGEATRVKITSVNPLEASPGVTLLVGWPTEARPNKWGSGPVRVLPDFFKELPPRGTKGTVASCGQGQQTLTFAAVFPRAEEELAYMAGVQVDYVIGDRAHRAVSNVEVGVCPQKATDAQPCSGAYD